MKFKESGYLALDILVYDKISFIRKGFKNDNELKNYVSIGYEKEEDSNRYITHVSLRGVKQDEYEFEVVVSGYFSIHEETSDEKKDYVLKYRTVSILFPYLRSEISVLTSQPGVTPVVLDATNTDGYVDELYGDNKENANEDEEDE